MEIPRHWRSSCCHLAKPLIADIAAHELEFGRFAMEEGIDLRRMAAAGLSWGLGERTTAPSVPTQTQSAQQFCCLAEPQVIS